tara:strand:+ start:36705 stop:37727 length:1023 start_codon:yes stop_codon:yes gene_type:complete
MANPSFDQISALLQNISILSGTSSSLHSELSSIASELKGREDSRQPRIGKPYKSDIDLTSAIEKAQSLLIESGSLSSNFVDLIKIIQDRPDEPVVSGWTLEPSTRVWMSVNMPLYYGDRPGFPLLREHIDLANQLNAGLLLNNLYGQRTGHHYDAGWPESKIEEIEAEFSRYSGAAIQLYLCIKERLEDGSLIDVDDDRVRDHWIPLVEQLRGWIGEEPAIDIGIDVGSANPSRWKDVHERLLAPNGVMRTVLEASVRDSNGLPALDVPQEFLHQHILARWGSVDPLPTLETPGSVLLWMTNHAWQNEANKQGVIEQSWEKGYALALEAEDLEQFSHLLI